MLRNPWEHDDDPPEVELEEREFLAHWDAEIDRELDMADAMRAVTDLMLKKIAGGTR
jgi:hypothetical protein